jgi:hypothetical protein
VLKETSAINLRRCVPNRHSVTVALTGLRRSRVFKIREWSLGGRFLGLVRIRSMRNILSLLQVTLPWFC